MGKSVQRKYCCLVGTCSCCGFVAVVLSVVAIILVLLYPSFMSNRIQQKLTIEEGHPTYEQLENPTLPIWKSIYFFNLTNPEGFQRGEKPAVDEIGPYSYSESRTKQFLNTSSDESLISYNQTRLFYFDQNTSKPGVKEDDIICTINLPLVSAVAEVEGLSFILKRLAVPIMKQIFSDVDAKLYMCIEATPLIWNFTTPLVVALHTSPMLVANGMNYPKTWVSIQQNNSINDTYPSIIHTGVGDIGQIGAYVQWDGLTNLGIWPGDSANQINGTEGLIFHPFLEKGDGLEVFVADAVRSFPLHYNCTVNHLGLTAYRYKIPLSVFESAFTNPENARWGSWCPDGLLYAGVTQYPPSPVFGSNPLFLYGDPILREKVEGLMSPDPNIHETIVDVEHITGTNIGAKQQMQINVQVNRTSDFKQLAKINGTLYYPMFYVNEHAELTPDFKHYLEENGLSELQLANTLIWVIFAILLILALVCAVIFLATCILFVKAVRTNTNSNEMELLLKN